MQGGKRGLEGINASEKKIKLLGIILLSFNFLTYAL
jgi:hypothetical protein